MPNEWKRNAICLIDLQGFIEFRIKFSSGKSKYSAKKITALHYFKEKDILLTLSKLVKLKISRKK